MDNEMIWEETEMVTDNDERIEKLEAEIIASKAFLSSLSTDRESDMLF
jgi:hypothetical protein